MSFIGLSWAEQPPLVEAWQQLTYQALLVAVVVAGLTFFFARRRIDKSTWKTVLISILLANWFLATIFLVAGYLKVPEWNGETVQDILIDYSAKGLLLAGSMFGLFSSLIYLAYRDSK